MSIPGTVRTWVVPAYVYRLYDSTNTLLYVGVSEDLSRRMRQHRRTKTWWNEVASVTAMEFSDEWMALIGERVAIADEAPKYNLRRKRVTEGDRRVTAQIHRLSPGPIPFDLQKLLTGDRW